MALFAVERRPVRMRSVLSPVRIRTLIVLGDVLGSRVVVAFGATGSLPSMTRSDEA